MYHGPARIVVTPETKTSQAGPYIMYARGQFAFMDDRPRFKKILRNGVIVEMFNKEDKEIRITFPLKHKEQGLTFGYMLTPTDDGSPKGYVGDTVVGLKTPIVSGVNDTFANVSTKPSLELFNLDKTPTTIIERFEGYKERITEDYLYAGTGQDQNHIHWRNVLYHDDGSGLFKIPRIIDLSSGDYSERQLREGTTFIGKVGNIGPVVLYGLNYHETSGIKYQYAHINVLFYRGNPIEMPSWSGEDTSIGVIYPNIGLKYGTRYAGVFYKDGKIVFIRSSPFMASDLYGYNATNRQEEICIASAAINEDVLVVENDVQILATVDYGQYCAHDLIWSDWKFNSDGTQAKAVKANYDGAGTGGPYWNNDTDNNEYEYTVDIDWDTPSAIVSSVLYAKLEDIDYKLDDTVQRATYDSFTGIHTFPWGSLPVDDGIAYLDLKHELLLSWSFGTLPNETLVMTWNTIGQVYSEDRIDGAEVPKWYNVPHPVLTTDNYESGEFEVFAYSHTTGYSGWPIQSYNSNDTLMTAAGFTDEIYPALNPMYHI